MVDPAPGPQLTMDAARRVDDADAGVLDALLRRAHIHTDEVRAARALLADRSGNGPPPSLAR